MSDNWWADDPVASPSGRDNWWEKDPAGGGTGPAPPALAGRQSTMSQGRPQSLPSRAWSAVHDWYFGGPDRVDEKTAKETGIGLTPTPSQMVNAGVTMASMVAAPAAASLRGSAILAEGAEAAAAAPEVTGTLAKAAQWVGRYPRLRNAALGALPGLTEGDTRAAKYGAGLGLILPGGRASQEAVSDVGKLLRSGKVEEARVLIEAIRAAASKEAGAAPSAIASLEKAAAPVVAEAAPVVTKAVDLGKAAVEKHRQLVAFAKEIAATKPKVGQKIWMLLDDAGRPIKHLTPDEAGAAKRKGLPTSFIKNLWG